MNQSNREDNLSGLNIDDYSKGIGDICRYMTARGWAPLGKKWKTPSGYELKTLENNHDLLTTIGPYGEDNSKSHQWGQYEVPAGTTLLNIYFPVSGLRDNSNGRLTNLSFGAYYNSSSCLFTSYESVYIGVTGSGESSTTHRTVLNQYLPELGKIRKSPLPPTIATQALVAVAEEEL